MNKIIIGVVTLVLLGYQAFAGKLLHAKVNCEHCKNSMGHRLTRRSIDLEDVATHLNDLRLPRERCNTFKKPTQDSNLGTVFNSKTGIPAKNSDAELDFPLIHASD
ncbi:unnamed protein product [Timema podura]|uniref:Uncharacterized protein n=1 Tax=Timema podura TaxID=61482 RepID=A0ABN7P0N8_TIMPD|nr:unnamed protein product [Timema podura]